MYTESNDEYSFSLPYLTAGETVLWKGKPGKGHLFTPADFIAIATGIFLCGIAYHLMAFALSSGMLFFWLFSIPFVCMGLYLAAGQFLQSAYMRRCTRYVITNKKIIRQRGGRIDTRDAKDMSPTRMIVRRNGSGNIQIGKPSHYRHKQWTYMDFRYIFTLENIPEVARVHQIISNMERQQRE